MINNRVGKGLAILGCQILAGILCLVFIGFILSPIVWIYRMVAHTDNPDPCGDARPWAWRRQLGQSGQAAMARPEEFRHLSSAAVRAVLPNTCV
jgi:hypothetical protein